MNTEKDKSKKRGRPAIHKDREHRRNCYIYGKDVIAELEDVARVSNVTLSVMVNTILQDYCKDEDAIACFKNMRHLRRIDAIPKTIWKRLEDIIRNQIAD